MKKIITAACVASTLLLAMPMFAAKQGTLGPTSEGTTDISLSIASEVQITDLKDIAFGTVPLTTDVSGFTPACIYSTAGSAATGYNVMVTGSGASNAFTVETSTTPAKSIAYTATWNNTNDTGGQALKAGITVPIKSGANTTSPSCDGKPNARLSINFTKTDLSAAGSGTYKGTATILISPA